MVEKGKGMAVDFKLPNIHNIYFIISGESAAKSINSIYLVDLVATA